MPPERAVPPSPRRLVRRELARVVTGPQVRGLRRCSQDTAAPSTDWPSYWGLFLSLPLAAAPSDTPLADAVVTNDTVLAIAVDPAAGIAYLSGDFTAIGPNTGQAAIATDASRQASKRNANGRVNALTGSGGTVFA